MPKDDINYSFTENGVVYDFYDVFVPAEYFRQPALWVWGDASFGQIGTNSGVNKSTPVTTFAGGTNWKQVSAGNRNTAAIKTDGTLWVWGDNGDGELGVNDIINKSTPVTTFAGGNNWKQVSCGANHTAAIKTDGTLWVWGGSTSGELGINFAGGGKSTPVTTFLGGNNWKSISVSIEGSYTVAIKTDGTLWTWGSNGSGQLGINDTNTRSTPVTTFIGGTNWKQVDCGASHTAAIKTDGTLWVWGTGGSGRLGTNSDSTIITPVTTFLGGNNWKQISCGNSYTAAIKTDGSLWTWGLNINQELGINSTNVSRSTPVTTFAGGTDWKSVKSCSSHSLATKTDGSLWTWGSNVNGQLGTNDTNTRSTPVNTFFGKYNWKQVSGGVSHSLAILYESDP